jgi:type I restriction enzyme S subunit
MTIPTGWEEMCIADIATEIRTFVRPVVGERYELWSVPSYTTGRPEILDGCEIGSVKLEVQPWDVLICKINPRINRVWLVRESSLKLPQIASPEWMVLRFPLKDRPIVAQFIAGYLRSPKFRRWITGAVSGVTGSHTRAKSKEILQQKVPFPPLAEQRRISAAVEASLSRIDSGIDRIRLARKRIFTMNEMLLAMAVNGELTELSDESASEFLSGIRARRKSLASKSRKPPNPAALDEYVLPSGWEMASLGEVSYSWGYGTSTKCNYEAAGVPVLRIPNIINGKIDATSDIKFAVDEAIDLSSLFLKPGDLLFVRTNGSPDLIGRVGIVDSPLDAAFASYLIRFQLISDGVAPDWIRIVVNSPIWRRHIVRSAASSAGQHNINSRILASIPIPIPPKGQQLEIISKLEKWQERSSILENVGALVEERARLLWESVLANAFSGRLVRQHPADDHV